MLESSPQQIKRSIPKQMVQGEYANVNGKADQWPDEGSYQYGICSEKSY